MTPPKPTFTDFLSSVEPHELERAYHDGRGASGASGAHATGLRAVLRLVEPAWAFLEARMGEMDRNYAAVAALANGVAARVEEHLAVQAAAVAQIEELRATLAAVAKVNDTMREGYAAVAKELGDAGASLEDLARRARQLVVRNALAHALVICVREMRRQGIPLEGGGMFGGILAELEAQWPEENELPVARGG